MPLRVANIGQAYTYLNKRRMAGVAVADEPDVVINTLAAAGTAPTARLILEDIDTSPTLVVIMAVHSRDLGTIWDHETGILFVNTSSITQAGNLRHHGAWVKLEIALFHELGHARQAILRPTWYRRMLQPENRKAGCYLAIEADNLNNHEYPLAAELGLPKRRPMVDLAAPASHNTRLPREDHRGKSTGWRYVMDQAKQARHQAGLAAAGLA